MKIEKMTVECRQVGGGQYSYSYFAPGASLESGHNYLVVKYSADKIRAFDMEESVSGQMYKNLRQKEEDGEIELLEVTGDQLEERFFDTMKNLFRNNGG